MEEALAGFKGTIFFISHDRYFINKISDRVIAIEEGAFNSYLGNYDYYKSIKDKQSRQAEEVLPVKPEQQSDKYNNDRKKATPKVERKEANAAKLESRIGNIESRLKEIEVSMEAVGINYEELNRLFEKKEELSKELEETMEVWLRMS
jgi:ATPase subunit of ABC transporter with duplicated ATPase domains